MAFAVTFCVSLSAPRLALSSSILLDMSSMGYYFFESKYGVAACQPQPAPRNSGNRAQFFSAVGFAVPQPVIFELIEVFQK